MSKLKTEKKRVISREQQELGEGDESSPIPLGNDHQEAIPKGLLAKDSVAYT